MSRQFDGAADRIATTIAAGLASYTYGTWAILFKMSAASDGQWAGMMNLHTTSFTSGGSSRAGLEKGDTGNDNRMNLAHGANSRKNPDAITNSDGWLLFVVGKGTGTVTPTWSLRTAGSGGTWSHGSMDGTLANGSSSDSARMVFGQWEGSDDFAGFLAAAAIWDEVNLNNTQRETLWPGSAAGSMSDWLDLTPTHAWQFNQSSTGTAVEDLMDAGGDESAINGTAVSADEPADWTYHSAGSGATATPAVIAISAVLPAATTSAGSTATPTTVATTSNLPAPTLSAGASVSPATLATTTAVPAATASAGSTAAPAAVAATAGLPAAATSAGSTANPAAVASSIALPAAAVTAGSTVTPASTSLAVSIPTPSVSGGGSATASPAVVALAAALPAASASAGALVVPTLVDLVAALPAPSLSAGVAVSPSTLALSITVPTPSTPGEVEPTGVAGQITTSTPVGRTTASTPPRMTTSSAGGRL